MFINAVFRRFSEGTSADREIQRTLMELLNQMDGFDVLGQVSCLLLLSLAVQFLGRLLYRYRLSSRSNCPGDKMFPKLSVEEIVGSFCHLGYTCHYRGFKS